MSEFELYPTEMLDLKEMMVKVQKKWLAKPNTPQNLLSMGNEIEQRGAKGFILILLFIRRPWVMISSLKSLFGMTILFV